VTNLPFITVVMPVRNEAQFIFDTLQHVLNQDYPKDRFEIIVADGMSEDKTREIVKEIVKEYPNVRLLDNAGRLPSSGRNVGFKNGKGDIFSVIDGHCYVPTDQLLKNIVDCFENSNAQCLGRPQPLDPPDLTDFQKAVALARSSKIGHSGNSLIYSDYEGYCSPVSNGAVYLKGIFKDVGYVDENFDACEDVEFNYRVEKGGFKAYTSPSLAIKYYPRENLKGLFKQMKRYGLGRFKFIEKHPEALNLNMLIPPAYVVGWFFLIFLGLLTSVLPLSLLKVIFIIFSVIYGSYMLLIIGESFIISVKKGLHFFKYLPFIFFTIHFGLGYGFIRQMPRSIFLEFKSK
jgi:succinoglycan biosynthesis protein ExoA